ncbi:hypothetical protein MMC20_001310 [Loxospora ochrophaea]|nr:hypothetical protein [Loxospora ochrophaea]
MVLFRNGTRQPCNFAARLEKTEKSSQPPSEISFLSLPRELRDQIYEYSLCYKTECLTFHMIHPPPKFWFKSGKAPNLSLLHVNRQIGHEAAETFYGSNVFRFEQYSREGRPSMRVFSQGPKLALEFLSSLRPTTRNMIRHIQLHHLTGVESEPLECITRSGRRYKTSADWLSFCKFCEENLRLKTLQIQINLRDFSPKSIGRLKQALKLLVAADCCQKLDVWEGLSPSFWRKQTPPHHINRLLNHYIKNVGLESTVKTEDELSSWKWHQRMNVDPRSKDGSLFEL